MPIEKQISELPTSTDFGATSILHSKDSGGTDIQVTTQQIIDLVTLPSLSTLIPSTETSVNTGSDFALFSDTSDGGEIKRIDFPAFISSLGIPAVSGSVTSGYYNIGDLQIRWGSEDSTTDAVQSFTFAVAFTNACFGVWINNSQANPTNPICSTTFSTTGFDVDRNSNIGGTVTFQYFAIGR